MNRREAINAVAALMGGTIIGSNLFLTGCKNADSKTPVVSLNAEHTAMLNEIAETIIPTTSSPGAKAAKVGEFMVVMVNDCYEEKNKKIFVEGLGKIDVASDKKFNKSFMEIDQKQRHDLLSELDNDQKSYMKNKKADEPSHYFRMMKELTLLGYFTSETGATKALRFVDIPGRYDACIPYKKGEGAWS